MSILFASRGDDPQGWEAALREAGCTLPFTAELPSAPDPAIRYLLTWQPPARLYRNLPELRAIFSLGAGVDHLFENDPPPGDIPIIRLRDAGMAEQMSEYALWAVIGHHRHMHVYRRRQQERRWAPLPARPAAKIRVLILGLGVLGEAVANTVRAQGYSVSGWARRPREIAGIDCLHGQAALETALGQTDVLINLLPLTAETRGMIASALFARLKPGACFVNIARGAHVVERDLLQALDSGVVDHAVLDVFAEEPLPEQHPFWTHPGITVTPHIAAQTLTGPSARQIAENIALLEAGGTPEGLVSREQGY